MPKKKVNPTPFERFVQKILAVPKQEVAEAEEADRRANPRAKRGPKTKTATS